MSETPDPVAPDEGAAPEPEHRPFTVLLFESVTFDLHEASPRIWLRENAPPGRSIGIPVALAEAQSLSRHVLRVPSPRPSTHDLFVTALTEAGCEVAAVRIVDFDAGVYYAEMDLMTPRGRKVIDCRPSDGINLALRQPVSAPILCDDELLSEHSTQRH